MALRLDTPLKVPPKSLPLDPENKKSVRTATFFAIADCCEFPNRGLKQKNAGN